MTQESNLLSKREAAIVNIAAFSAAGNMAEVAPALNSALDNGLTVNEIKEVLVQVYAYAGFPRSLNAIGAFMDVLKRRQAKSIKDTEGEAGKFLPAGTDKRAYGAKVQTELVGAEVKGGAMDFAPAIDMFLKEHLFADIFGRGVLSHQDRELATLAMLSVLEGAQPQLNSHINMSKNIGISDAKIQAAISLAKNTNKEKLDTIFARGEENPYGKFFTGQTYLNMLNANDDVFNAPIGNVTFEPCARTNWHKHSGGQILLVTAGEGRYQERGKDIRILKKGDTVRIAPDIEHWHGAAPNTWFTHISIETNVPNNKAVWLEPVTEEQYK
ncbi:hypothetical protein AAIR98_001359 [Elusimicrobium simillimum]|uniref:carboxymuconolactone decarboxylase family protein n=1 Tax=Elusimicrobium simillimum TaxID=3143438 RepID=UPI003C6F88AF